MDTDAERLRHSAQALAGFLVSRPSRHTPSADAALRAERRSRYGRKNRAMVSSLPGASARAEESMRLRSWPWFR